MYFISAVDIYNEAQSQEYIEYSSKCVGYYFSLDDAVQAVKENGDDIHRTIYNYAVIEEIDEGIHLASKKEIWFKWDEETKRYESADKPQKIKNTGNLSMG